MDELKLVIVGHVDHGKSTLIGRLLYDTNSLPEGKIDEIKEVCEMLGKDFEFGFILDNLEEERDQGITIDTTQIWFKTPEREYNIIDAPGHVEFIKNMITGASQAEAAILIVDASEGVQQQTKRHAYIIKMLGLNQVIAVINKMDLVGYDKSRFEEVKTQLNEFLSKIDIKPNYVIPISAQKGDNIAKKSDNMQWYNGPTIIEALASFKPYPGNEDKPLRFAVQDVYKWDKRIVVGIVESGVLHKGNDVLILPSGLKTKVESIEEFMKENVTEAPAGKAIGIVTKDKVFIDRGNILSDLNNPPKLTKQFKAHIFWMSGTPLKNGERITMKLSTQEAISEVKILKVIDSSSLEEKGYRDRIENNEVGVIELITEKPIVVEDFNKIQELGRFVLEKDNVTVGGGIITEVE